jgi:CII-binding regulator of phage lambda lysogenization HflD
MVDLFPFPKLNGNTPEEQITELVRYLTDFKELLEFELRNISMENLSPELMNKIKGLGTDIEQTKENREEELAQITKIIRETVATEISKITT